MCYNKSGQCILTEEEKKISFICRYCQLFNPLNFDQLCDKLSPKFYKTEPHSLPQAF